MNKTIIVINGAGGAGKDTLIDAVKETYIVMNVSAITPITMAARELGWNNAKDDKSRKFLSELKQASIAYNDHPTKYLLEKVDRFLMWCAAEDVMFVHIREPEEIAKFIDRVYERYKIRPVTLLVRRKAVEHEYGNTSDDGVENYDYDFVFDNDLPIKQSGWRFMGIIERIKDKARERRSE